MKYGEVIRNGDSVSVDLWEWASNRAWCSRDEALASFAYILYPTTRALCACALTTGTRTENACMQYLVEVLAPASSFARVTLCGSWFIKCTQIGHGSRTHVDGPRALRSCKLLSFERPALHEPDRQESPIWDRMGRQVLWWSMLECLSGEPSRQRSQRSFGGGLAWHMGRGEVLAPNIQHGAWWHVQATGR